jgi:uncharacterized membrane protein
MKYSKNEQVYLMRVNSCELSKDYFSSIELFSIAKLLSAFYAPEETGGNSRVNFETSKNLSCVGAILIFAGPIVSFFATIFVGAPVAFVGLLLLLMGVRNLAVYYSEPGIFNNTLYSGIAAILGFLAFVAIAFVAFLNLLSEIGVTPNIGNISDLPTLISNISVTALEKFVGFILLDIAVLFVFMLVTAIMLRKSLGLFTAKTGLRLFGTTGIIMLAGGALTIIFGIGLILMWIATLLLAIALFQIRPRTPEAEIAQVAIQTPV